MNEPAIFYSEKRLKKVFEKLAEYREKNLDIRTFFEMTGLVSTISNNKEDRAKPFAKAVKSEYIFDAHKPSTKNYIKAMEIMNTTKETTLFLGDQIFTDVWGANRAGIKSIMLEKINPKEEIQIVLKRIPEKFIMWSYKRKNKI